MPRQVRLGMDIGGTFTDFLLVDDATGESWVGKIATTPDDPARAVEAGLAQVLAAAGARGEELAVAVHGTTLVTNAILERKGDVTALVTTRGFRDAVEIAREHRYDMYDLFLELPRPIAPRRLRFEVDERLLADGSVHREVDEASVRRLAAELAAAGVEAVAVCLLHSYRNPAHERRVGALLAEALPEARISLSAEVVGEIREYERASTTLANVYVQRLVERYLDRIERLLETAGAPGRLLVMLSSGGLATTATAKRFPVRLIESGPAAGALAAAHAGRASGRPDLLSFDMGGTTAKACLIEGGRPFVATEFEIDRVYRFKKGSGLPIKAPAIEMIEIGAGGGSIARVDRFGLVKVGPDSAGAVPGPACYGRGGAEPTVTDANLLLGLLDPAFFLGGDMSLDAAAAERAVREAVAQPLGLDPVEAAWTVHQVVNESMAAAARIHAVERGKDVRDFPLFAFGGAGPLHAYRVAELLGVREIVCPPAAGVGSTIGFLAAPLAFDLARSSYALLDGLDVAAATALYDEMEAEGRAVLAAAGVAAADVRVARSADMQLAGQAHSIAVPLADWPRGIAGAFDATYRALYGRTPPGVPVEVMTWRLTVGGPPPGVSLGAGTAAGPALKGERPVYDPAVRAHRATPVYDRYALRPGDRLEGPAIVEERESTLVVGAGGTAEVDAERNVVVALP